MSCKQTCCFPIFAVAITVACLITDTDCSTDNPASSASVPTENITLTTVNSLTNVTDPQINGTEPSSVGNETSQDYMYVSDNTTEEITTKAMEETTAFTTVQARSTSENSSPSKKTTTPLPEDSGFIKKQMIIGMGAGFACFIALAIALCIIWNVFCGRFCGESLKGNGRKIMPVDFRSPDQQSTSESRRRLSMSADSTGSLKR